MNDKMTSKDWIISVVLAILMIVIFTVCLYGGIITVNTFLDTDYENILGIIGIALGIFYMYCVSFAVNYCKMKWTIHNRDKRVEQFRKKSRETLK